MTRLARSLIIAAVAAALLLSSGCAERREATSVHMTLDNGATLITRENRASEVVAIDVFVRDGALFEKPQEAGEANLLRSLLFYRTETQPAGEIQRTIEGLGGAMASAARHDFVLYTFVVPSASFYETLGLIVDGLSNAVLDETVLDRHKSRAMDSMKQMISRPVDRAYRLCLSEMMGGHPYGRQAEGEPDTIENMSIDDLRDRYERVYTGPNLIISVSGNIDAVAAADKMNEAFSVFPGGEPAEPAAPPVTWPDESSRLEVETDVVKAAQVIGFPGPSVQDEDNISMDVLLVILMEGRSSKLNARLKEELGLVSSIGAGWYTQLHPSPLFVWMELPEENAEAAEAAVVELFDELSEELVEDDVLDKAKMQLKVGHLRMTETSSGQAFDAAYWTFVGGMEFAEQYTDRLAAVTAEEVRRAARRYLASGAHTAALLVPE
jgi:predicted Zn-dependent peptidase